VSPSEEYRQRLTARQQRVVAFDTVHIRLGNIRLLIAICGAGMAWVSFSRHMLAAWWLIVPLAAFIVLAAYHSRVLRERTLAERAVTVYRNGLARIEDHWTGMGQTGERFLDPHHIYAADLDLFGRGGLFELLSLARTRMGEDTLAGWLLSPGVVEDVQERHSAVAELRERLDLREDVAVLGEHARVGVHPEHLLLWAESRNRLPEGWVYVLATALAVCSVLGAGVWAVWDRVLPFLVSVSIGAGVTYWLRKPIEEVLHGAEHAFEDLDLLSAVLARFERESFSSKLLVRLNHDLPSHQEAGSIVIARLRKLVQKSESRHNMFLRIVDVPLMYSVRVAYAAEKWRTSNGGAVRRWLSALGEMEALLSLSAYAYEHPNDPFPEFELATTCFEADGLGHPLIPASMCVRNSLALGQEARVLLVSGSNMSGKSTLMRAVGVNTVLAMAGAPVRARRLKLAPLQVGASIRVNDSLQEGSSRFYAEITRLRQLFDFAAGSPPLLFLLDELLQGTNSKDRRIGAEGIVRALVGRGAIGIVSTHDLALTDIGGPLDGHLHNVHFQDELIEGKMRFDYQLREGIVTKSNGLELMRSIGLEV
jgi:hypothetical protein